jgi:hypothetical protein
VSFQEVVHSALTGMVTVVGGIAIMLLSKRPQAVPKQAVPKQAVPKQVLPNQVLPKIA